MTIYINEEDKKLFEQNGYNQQSVGDTVNHYRSIGLSDDEIQGKINQRLEGWRTPVQKQPVKTEYTYPNQDLSGIANNPAAQREFQQNIDNIYNIPQVPMPPRNNAGYTNSNGEVVQTPPNLLQTGINAVKQIPQVVDAVNAFKNNVQQPVVNAGRAIARPMLPKGIENNFLGSQADEALLKRFDGVQFPSWQELDAQYKSGAMPKDVYIQTLKDKLAVENARLDKGYRNYRNTEAGKEALLLGLSIPAAAATATGTAVAAPAAAATQIPRAAQLANLAKAASLTGLKEGAKFGAKYGAGASLIDKNLNPITEPIKDAASFGAVNAVLNPILQGAVGAVAGANKAFNITGRMGEAVQKAAEAIKKAPEEFQNRTNPNNWTKETVYEKNPFNNTFEPKERWQYKPKEAPEPRNITPEPKQISGEQTKAIANIAPKTAAKIAQEGYKPKTIPSGAPIEQGARAFSALPQNIIKNNAETVTNNAEYKPKQYKVVGGKTVRVDAEPTEKIKKIAPKTTEQIEQVKNAENLQANETVGQEGNANENIVTEEKKNEKPTGKLSTFKYKVTINKDGLTADGLYMEGSNFHTDGNAAYLKEFVNADTSKVARTMKATDTNEQQLGGMFEKAGNYTVKAEDIGKGFVTPAKRGNPKETKRVFQVGNYDNGEPRYVVVNDKYLLDKKDIELYVDNDNLYAPISVRKNGKQIGVVMPIMMRGGMDGMVDIPQMKSTAKKAVESKPEEKQEQIPNENITETTEESSVVGNNEINIDARQIKSNETSEDFVKRILDTKIEKYKPTTYTIDWGSLRSQQQEKRSNGMVKGSMGDMTLQGEKEYKRILGGLPEYENIKNEFGNSVEGEQMKVAYLKAREAGFNQEESLDFAYTLFEHENLLYKKLKDNTPKENNPTPKEVKETGKAVEPKEVKKSELKKKEVSEKSDKYEDYGEKIHGARKDIWQSYNEILAKKLPETYEEFTKTKLSDVFPDINGEKFIENGGNPDTMTVIKLLRDSIPTKPSGRKAMMQHYRKEWTDAIKEHREYTQKLLDGEMTADEAVNKLVYNEKSIDFDLKRKADAYRAVGYPACKNIKGYMLDKGGVSVKDSETGEYRKEERWYITRENRFGLTPFKTREEAVDYLKAIAGVNSTPAKREAKLEIGRWSDERKANGYMIYYKAGTGKYIELKNKFETAKEAKEYLNEHKEELLEQLNKLKEEPPMRGEVNEPRIGKGFRKGKNVNPEEFSKTFGFRGIQFGNYVESTKRIEDINNAYDSLMDMSEVLNIPEKAISLNGELGLAFGARGKGGKHAASAHYELAQVVINLTKNKGAGSLAHEWWHALDNYFGKKNNSEMATETYGTRTPEFREEMAKAYSDVKSAVRKAIYSRSKELDKTRSKDYWSTDVEMTARAFETYIKHKIDSQGFSNDYLANIIGENIYKNLGREDAYPYPTKAEMPEIEKAFDNFFKTIKTRETEKGVELYDIDVPSWMNDYKYTAKGYKDIDLETLNSLINKGCTQDELLSVLPSDLHSAFRNIKGYKFYNFRTDDKGIHYGGKIKQIGINLSKVGNNPRKFVDTLMHEVEHADQEVYYNYLKNKNNLTPNEIEFIKAYKRSNRLNRVIMQYLKDNKLIISKVVNPFLKKNANLSEEEFFQNVNNIKNKLKRDIIKKHIKYIDKYWDLFREVGARESGKNYSEVYIDEERSYDGRRIEKSNTHIQNSSANRNIGATIRSRFRGNDENLSIGGYRGEVNKNTSDEINQVVRDKVYDWHGKLESDRYDVDKSLNSFIQLTKHRAKNLSQKTGVKISDKQLREILPFLRERTGFPKSLERDDLRTIFDKLSGSDKAELAKLADSISDKFEKYYTNYKDAKGEQTEESIENHISHIWDLDDKKKSLLTNYITTNSKFAKKRTIGTFVEGIDGIEINGEKVQFKPKTLDYAEILKSSSDNLIKATHDSILANEIKNLKYKGESMVLPASKAPSEWIEVNHPALNKAVYQGAVGEDEIPMLMKTPVKVHPEIADYVNAIFEVQKPDKFLTRFDALNGTVKQVLLGLSGFHGYALSESSVGNVGLNKTLKELNPFKIYDQIKNGNYDIYKNEEAAKRAINAGVQLGTPSDLQRNLTEEFLLNGFHIEKFGINKITEPVGKLAKPFGIVAHSLTRINNKILWDVLHNNFKILAFNTAIENLGENVTKEQERAVAQWVNDSFGGQAWELLGIKKSSVKAASRVLLSPDWNFSTIRQANAMFNSSRLDKLSNSNSKVNRVGKLLGINEEFGSKGARGKLGRGFWLLRSAIYFGLMYNALNAAFREKDRKEHPELYPNEMTPMDYTIWANAYPMDNFYEKALPNIFIGRNKDGSARYLRLGKQFREVPEFLFNFMGKLGGKTAPLLSMAFRTYFGMGIGDAWNKLNGGEAYLDQNIWEGYGENAEKKEGLELAKGRAVVALKSVAPFMMSKYLSDNKHEFSWWDLVAQTHAGGAKSTVFKQTKEALKAGKPEVIEEIERRAYQDGVPIKDIEGMIEYAKNDYKSENTKKYKNKLVKSFENEDEKEYERIRKKMNKKHLSDEEQRRIRDNAWKEYQKSKKN